jgi:hypothetical protein
MFWNGTFFSLPTVGMMKILSFGMPLALAALSAVSKRGTHVKRTCAPDDLSWCVSSTSVYAALAGVAIPDNL